MSHEIRTPLNGILGFAKLLLQQADGDDPAARREFLEIIRTSGEHLLELINDILDLSKIESKQMEVESIACSPHQLLAEVISILRVRSQEKGLRLETTWAGPIPETIQTDPARLRQLLMNLVGNAIKFTEAGGVQIVTRLIVTDGQPQLAIHVIDTGIGIPADKLESIFEPFVQADPSVTRRFGGTGLGLAISRRIAAALGGTITVESRVGEGSTFTATIATGPLEGIRLLQSPPEAITSVHYHDRSSEPTIQLQGIRVLGRRRRHQPEIDWACPSSCRSDSRYRRERPGGSRRGVAPILRLDSDGHANARYGRIYGHQVFTRRGMAVPIVALTAHAMRGDEGKCRDAGCSDFLTKPIDPDALLGTPRDSGSPTQTAPLVARTSRRHTVADKQPLVSVLPTEDPEFREIAEGCQTLGRTTGSHALCVGESGTSPSWPQLAHWLKGDGGTAGFPAFTDPASKLLPTGEGPANRTD